MKRKNKSTSFDITDEYELKLLEHAERSGNGKYSKYIKRLIARDMEGVRTSPVVNNVMDVIKVNDMDGFL